MSSSHESFRPQWSHDVRLPTLIIERLGALTPVRFEDEELIVVGARDEEGIDLADGLDELDHVGEWVLDHGRKVRLDISTYNLRRLPEPSST